MSLQERRTVEDTRARIMEVAWDLFRELGARTTVADVASKLGMSSANVYRFFASKQALCEAVAAHQLGQMSAAAREMASGPGSAAERLRAMLMGLFQAMRDQMINQARVHEIVDVAIREHWAPIKAYELQIAEILAGLVAEGQARGEFGPGDPALLAIQTLCACAGIHHPLLIAHHDGPDAKAQPEEIVDFALRALTNRAGYPGSQA
jgi:AcrR family transcriptional regulator